MGLAFASCAARSRIRCGTSRESGMVPPYGYNSRKNTFLPPYSHAVLTSMEYTPHRLFISKFTRIVVCFLVREDLRKSVGSSKNSTVFQQEALENPGRIFIHEEFVQRPGYSCWGQGDRLQRGRIAGAGYAYHSVYRGRRHGARYLEGIAAGF